MKLGVLVNAAIPFQKLSQADLSLKSSYQLKKLTAKLQPELEFFTQERNKILEKHGTKNGDTAVYNPIPDQKAEWDIAFDQLLNHEIEIEFNKMQIPLTENIKLSANDITFLESFVDFIEEE